MSKTEIVNFTIKVKFFTYWHCSSGSSGGSSMDALVARDENNLPYIPGKTLKGHIRDMAITLKNDEDNKIFVNNCFGYSTEKEDFGYDKSKLSKPNKEREGKCYFSNATLNELIEPKLSEYLYTSIASTAIGNNGIAKTGSLREIEAVVPLTLQATIKNIPIEYQDKMKKAIMQVKRIGLNRTRGWGRCEITIEQEEEQND